MQLLSTVVVEFLRSNVPALGGRVHVAITPEGEQLPAAVVDTASQHDGELERAGVTVRIMTESHAGADASTELADLTAQVSDALTGTGPALELDGYEILDVAGANSLSYAESSEGRRVIHAATEFDVMLERKRA